MTVQISTQQAPVGEVPGFMQTIVNEIFTVSATVATVLELTSRLSDTETDTDYQLTAIPLGSGLVVYCTDGDYPGADVPVEIIADFWDSNARSSTGAWRLRVSVPPTGGPTSIQLNLQVAWLFSTVPTFNLAG